MKKFLGICSCLVCFLIAPGCAENKTASASEPLVITLRAGQAEIAAEVALTPRQQARGLMHRKSLPDNSGMLFFLPKEMQASFWMKNTYIPLSIAFIDRYWTILEIHDMEPLSEKIIASASASVLYALEMNKNWFSLNGLKPGDKIVPPPNLARQLAEYRSRLPND